MIKHYFQTNFYLAMLGGKQVVFQCLNDHAKKSNWVYRKTLFKDLYSDPKSALLYIILGSKIVSTKSSVKCWKVLSFFPPPSKKAKVLY